jgi:hypothetical protein
MPDLLCRDVRTGTIPVFWMVSGHHHNSTAVGLLVKYHCVAVCVGYYQRYLVALSIRTCDRTTPNPFSLPPLKLLTHYHMTGPLCDNIPSNLMLTEKWLLDCRTMLYDAV